MDISPESFSMLGSALTDRNYSDVAPQGFVSRLLYGNTLGESPADTALNRSGSIMGSAKTLPRETAARQGPGLATLSDIINSANPINWMGGFGGSAAGVTPALRTIGGKVFRDAAAPTVAPWSEVLKDLVKRGEPLNRRSMRPALRTGSGVVVGDTAGGHGALWESISPAQQRGAMDGYVDGAGRFFTRDQSNIAAGSMAGIKAALENARFEGR